MSQGPRVIAVPRRIDSRGILSVLESPGQIPFQPVRLFILTAVPPGVTRGGHAHRECHQLLLVPTGRIRYRATGFDGTTLSGELGPDSSALYLPPMSWVDLDQFLEGAALVVLASHPYDEADYVRDHAIYQRMRSEHLSNG